MIDVTKPTQIPQPGKLTPEQSKAMGLGTQQGLAASGMNMPSIGQQLAQPGQQSSIGGMPIPSVGDILKQRMLS